MDEVMEGLVNTYGFVELDANSDIVREEYKAIYRYYGVTKEDISKKTERYNNVVRALSE